MGDPERDYPTKDVQVAAKDADDALKFITEGETITMTPEDEKKLLRKIDMRVLPLLFGCYFLQYLDKTLINYAAVMGLKKDTKITGDQYSELAMVFYVSYLACEFPSAYLVQRLPTAKFLGAIVCAWGIMVTCNAAAHDWGGLVSLRVLLGVFESGVAPSLMLITTMWYKKSEQPPRVGSWYVGTGVGKMVGAITSFGFQHYTGQQFKSWQIMFLVWGLITVALGLLVLFFLPNNPMTSRFTETEKRWAVERLRSNLTGVENKHWKWHQLWELMKDPQMYLLGAIVLTSNIPNGFISSYQATVIESFGWTSKETALLSIPSGAIACICTLGGTWFAGKYSLRGPAIIILLSLGFTGSCLMAFLPPDAPVGAFMVGNYLANCIGSSLPLMYSYAGANFSGHSKKVSMNAIVLIMFCIGNIIGPLTFREQDAPEYIPAKIGMVVTTALAALLTGVLMMYYRWENNRRDRVYADHVHVENSEFFDLTDRENPEFRYVF